MQELVDKFETLYIDKIAVDSPLARRLSGLFPENKIKVVKDRPFAESKGELSAREFDRSKRNLYLTPFKGQFFKRCPGSRPGLSCCNYYVLNWGLQCDMNCSYCYLQSFINSPVLTLYTNLEDAFRELDELDPETPLRIGTGETVDSLSLDPLTLFSRPLIEYFRKRPKWTLEFKSKSAYVDQFLDREHAGNVIVSWSVNPQPIIDSEEHGTAGLEERLRAAEKARDRGFPLAFHIDPMIWHPEWEVNYTKLVDMIAARFRPQEVVVMSVGALRYQPEQKAMMRERFGMKSLVTQAETFPSGDGKLRYDAKLRQMMFSLVLERFKFHSPDWRIFMCMETPESWLSTVGQSPFKKNDLQEFFVRRKV